MDESRTASAQHAIGPDRASSALEARLPHRAILELVDDLAILAADLWLAGKLEGFPTHEEPSHDEVS
jgi:hypothetical protein